MVQLQLESLRGAQEQVEAFASLYTASQEDATVGRDLEKAYRLTLEGYFGADFAKAAEFSQEGIADVIKRLGRATANAGGRIQRGWKEFIAAFGDGWGKLENRVQSIESTLDSIDSKSGVKKEQIKMAGGSRLHVKTSMAPKDIVDVYPAAMTALSVFATASTDFGNNVARWMDYIVGNLTDIYIYLFQTTRAVVEYCERGAANYEK